MDGKAPARQRKMSAALVMFAKAPIPGQVKTRLSPDLTADEAATLHGSFVLDTLERTKAAASKFNLPIDRFLACAPSSSHVFFRIMEARHGVTLLDQQGDDLGARMHHIFDHFGPVLDREIGQRQNGVLIANGQGKALAYALFNLQERGRLMVNHGDDVYEGQVIGIHSRDNDLVVNPLKAKKLTNIRAAGRDENIILTPPIRFTLEQAMEFIADDELVEVTPGSIRLRKRALKEHERKRAGRAEETVE